MSPPVKNHLVAPIIVILDTFVCQVNFSLAKVKADSPVLMTLTFPPTVAIVPDLREFFAKKMRSLLFRVNLSKTDVD